MAMELKTVQGVIAVAAPSDTHHLASLLETMNPKIVAKGDGAVSIGGRLYDIRKQMLDDFRAYDLVSTVRAMTKPLLAFHSPSDETVGFQNALVPDGATPLNDRISVVRRYGHYTYFCGVEPVFLPRKTRGATVMTDDVIAEAQDLLNRAQSRRQIIEKLGMKYDTVRKAINQG